MAGENGGAGTNPLAGTIYNPYAQIAANLAPIVASGQQLVTDMGGGTTTPAVTTPLSTSQKIAATIAAAPPAPAGYHYGKTLDANGKPILYYDLSNPNNPSTKQQSPAQSAAAATGAATATTASTVKPGGSANADPGALQIVTDALKMAGLGNLASKAWTMWNSGLDFNAIMDDPTNGIRASAEYKQNFPAMAALNAKGQGISEKQYLDKETADLELMKQYGIPTGVFDSKEYLGSLMTNNVTQVDLEKRLMAVQQTANSFDSNITNYAKDTYGLSTGDLMAYMLDPNKALPVIQQKAQAMQIGGAAYQQGFAGGLGINGELSQTQAEALAAQGIDQGTAQKGFLNIAQEGQLAQALPGDTSGSVTNQQLINAQFGVNAEDLTAVKKVQSKRVAEYQQGGAFAAGAAGASGLGVANAGS